MVCGGADLGSGLWGTALDSPVEVLVGGGGKLCFRDVLPLLIGISFRD